MIEVLRDYAHDLADGEREYIGVIELASNFEEKLPRIISRYSKEFEKVYQSFDDPEYGEEENWVDARYQLRMDFLIKHRLAKRVG